MPDHTPSPLTPEEDARLPKSLGPVLEGFRVFVNDRCCSLQEERECDAEQLALERDILALVDGLAALREENARLSEEVLARVAQVEDLKTENGRLRAANVVRDPAPVETHCSNCGRAWCVDAMGDARCCWEPRKCSRGAHQSAPAQEAREG